ncbi:MAG: SDR family oxidoreductase [Actinobacteria bacterium]|nr:SDR family oxidoreductase [Actinomycetota bacterium]
MLTDKVCIVTGAGRGIGRATAQEMARRGAKVAAAGVSDENGEETVRLIEADGGEAAYVHCDVREEAQIEALMEATLERFGGIDVLHNNAGTHETYFTDHALLEELPTDIWTRVIEVNLRGPWLTTKHAIPHLRRSKRGPNIINCGSTGGLLGFSPGSAYCPSKAGVIHLTRLTAIEVAPEIRCNSYCPGSTDTPMVGALAWRGSHV